MMRRRCEWIFGLLLGCAACSDDERGGTGDAVATDTGGGVPEVATDSGGSDSGFEYPCEPAAIETCVTACGSTGVRQCLKDWGPCVPLAEQCGNCKDDDCNGVVDDSCPDRESCEPVDEPCPVAVITVTPGTSLDVGATVSLSAESSVASGGEVAAWLWTVEAPPGSTSTFSPSATAETTTFALDVAGQFLFRLRVTDTFGTVSCQDAVVAVRANPFPPLESEVGCADGQREGYLDEGAYPQVAACAGAWTRPGITPDSVVPSCGRKGGDDGPQAEGGDCSAADLCADGWHVCRGWQDLAARSPTGCAGAVPAGAREKSLFFAIAQPSANNIVCGAAGAGDNDVFGCGNLGVGLGPDRQCGPLDRALASTQPDRCGFNEAEPNLGPWQCIGGPGSDLHEGRFVTKRGCPNRSCSYDGQPLGNSDKGGVICCRDVP